MIFFDVRDALGPKSQDVVVDVTAEPKTILDLPTPIGGGRGGGTDLAFFFKESRSTFERSVHYVFAARLFHLSYHTYVHHEEFLTISTAVQQQ